MSKPEILEEKPITMVELKESLDKSKKKGDELNFRANKTMEYLQEFVKIKPAQQKEIIDNIEKLNIPRIKEEHIIKIIDTLPQSVEELKVLLSGYPISISVENMKKLVDVVNSVVK